MIAAMLLALAAPLFAQVNLVDDPKQWSAGTDRPPSTITLAPAETGVAADVSAGGPTEDYPKLTRMFAKPQDWQGYARLRLRVRATCDDPAIRERPMTIVFYDDQTRRQDLADHPMTQQSVAHSIPVGKWLDVNEWLVNIHRSTIRQVQLYLYNLPPGKPYKCHWEIARLELEKVEGDIGVFDGEVFGLKKMQGAVGQPVGRVKTTDGLELALGDKGEVSQVALAGRPLGAATAAAACGLMVRDVTREDPPSMAGGKIEQDGDAIRQTATLDDLGLAVNATYRSRGEYLEIAGTVADLRGQDRAVTVYFALPLEKGPWQWWDSAAACRTKPDERGELACLEPGMEYGLGGAHSKYPLGAVSLPDRGGLTLGVRMDEPVVHRIACNPKLGLFYIGFDFGLVPEKRLDGRPLSEAPFRILLYSHGAAWGMRSALQRYYSFFPDFFTQRVKRQGGWYVWGDVKDTAGALDAGFGFHWGPSGPTAVKWDNANGLLALLYIEGEFFQQTMGDYNRAPTLDEAIARLKKVAAGDKDEIAKFAKLGYASGYAPGNWVKEHSLAEALQAIAKAAVASVQYGADGQPYGSVGQFPWMAESKWGIIFPCNLSPALPGGKGEFNRKVYLDYNMKEMEAAGAHYDGIALDSLGGYGQLSRANYRREHFKYADFPLSFSARERVPVQLAFLTTIEWVRDLAKDMHARNMVLMANCSWNITPGWLTFCAPYLDIFGAEATQFDDPDFIRAIAFRKSCTDLPYNPRPEWEVPWHLLHDIYPGHGNDVAVMKRTAPLLRDLAAAGWEPITGARTNLPVRIERYGSGDRVFLSLHNPGEKPLQAEVDLDPQVLGAAEWKASVQPGGQSIALQATRLTVPLAAHGTVVINLSP